MTKGNKSPNQHILKAEARGYYIAGKNLAEVSQIIGLDRSTIWRWHKQDKDTPDDWDYKKSQAKAEAGSVQSNADIKQAIQSKVAEERAKEIGAQAVEKLIHDRQKFNEKTLERSRFIEELVLNEIKPIRTDIVGTNKDGSAISKVVIEPNAHNLKALEQAANILKITQAAQAQALGIENNPAPISNDNNNQSFVEKIRSLHGARGHTPQDQNLIKFRQKTN